MNQWEKIETSKVVRCKLSDNARKKRAVEVSTQPATLCEHSEFPPHTLLSHR